MDCLYYLVKVKLSVACLGRGRESERERERRVKERAVEGGAGGCGERA